MSKIRIRMSDVLVTSNQLKKQGTIVASTRGQLASVANSIDRRIVARRGISGRLHEVDRSLRELERRYASLAQLIDRSMNLYIDAESRIRSQGRNFVLSRKPVNSSNLSKFKEIRAQFSSGKKRSSFLPMQDGSYFGRVYHVLNSGFLNVTFKQAMEQTIKKPIPWIQQRLEQARNHHQQVTLSMIFNVLHDDYLRGKAQTIIETVKNPDLKWYEKTWRYVQTATQVGYTQVKSGAQSGFNYLKDNPKQAISTVMDFLPFVGNIKGGVEALSGKDYITGYEFQNWERGVAAAAIFGGGFVKAGSKGIKLAKNTPFSTQPHTAKRVTTVDSHTVNASGGTTNGIGKTVKPNDVVPYRPSNSPLENHHGVMDVWAKYNVPNYVSRGGNTPTVALTKEQHNSTKAVYRQWLYEKTGKKVGGKVDWQSVSPREIQELTERMFDAAKVPKLARQEYYNFFNKYSYRE